MLTGQIMPTFGEIVLPVDYDLITGFKNPQEQIGLCSQNNILLPSLTAREHLELYSRIKLKSHFNAEVRRVMENLKLGKYKNYRVDQLSGGFKRRLCIAIAFLGMLEKIDVKKIFFINFINIFRLAKSRDS